jgi:hypothetical protein
MEPLTVKVLLNHSRSGPYTDTDRLREASSFQIDLAEWGSVERLLSIVLEQLTIAEPSEEWACRYRQGYNRSFRVGDVVMIGECAWALDGLSGDWRPVSVEASQMVAPGMMVTRILALIRQWHNWRAFTRHDVTGEGSHTSACFCERSRQAENTG